MGDLTVLLDCRHYWQLLFSSCFAKQVLFHTLIAPESENKLSEDYKE